MHACIHTLPSGHMQMERRRYLVEIGSLRRSKQNFDVIQ